MSAIPSEKVIHYKFSGLDAMRSFQAELLSDVREAIEEQEIFDVLLSETFEGRLENLRKFSQVIQGLGELNYKGERKLVTWIWKKPDSLQNLDDGGETGILRSVLLPFDRPLPTDLSTLEFIDIHSQLLGVIGLSVLRFEDLVDSWCLLAENDLPISLAGVSRNLLESTAALFDLAKKVELQWNLAKAQPLPSEFGEAIPISGSRHPAALNFRRLMSAYRYEGFFNDSQVVHPSLIEQLRQRRHKRLIKVAEEFKIRLEEENLRPPSVKLMPMIRQLSKALKASEVDYKLIVDYELISNVVHPSLGGQRLYTSRLVMEPTFNHHVGVGKKWNSFNWVDGKPVSLTQFGVFSNAICKSALSSVQVYSRLVRDLIAIADDIAMTAQLADYSLGESWRGSDFFSPDGCKCEGCRTAVVSHEWGASSPTVPHVFDVDLNFYQSFEFKGGE